MTSIKWSEVAQSCLTLYDPVDCNPPGSSVHGILQARILEWAAISFFRGSSRPRDRTWVSGIAGRCFIPWATRSTINTIKVLLHSFTWPVCLHFLNPSWIFFHRIKRTSEWKFHVLLIGLIPVHQSFYCYYEYLIFYYIFWLLSIQRNAVDFSKFIVYLATLGSLIFFLFSVKWSHVQSVTVFVPSYSSASFFCCSYFVGSCL